MTMLGHLQHSLVAHLVEDSTAGPLGIAPSGAAGPRYVNGYGCRDLILYERPGSSRNRAVRKGPDLPY